MSLAAAAMFCLYFALAEGTGAIRASPGKRFMRLAVLGRDGGQPSRTTIIQRAAIVAAFVQLDWNYILPPSLTAWL